MVINILNTGLKSGIQPGINGGLREDAHPRPSCLAAWDISLQYRQLITGSHRAGDVVLAASPTLPVTATQAPIGGPGDPGAMDGNGGIPPGYIQKLPRGGMMVMTSAGWIQFGTPMWTNKDAFARFAAAGGFGKPKGLIPSIIPTTYVFDTDYVPESVGLLALDFLQYMYFVTQGTTFHLVAPDKVILERAQEFLNVSYRCPEEFFAAAEEEYPKSAYGKPNLKEEVTRGFTSPHPESLRQVHQFENGQFTTDKEIRIVKIETMVYEVHDQGRTYKIDLNQYPIPTHEISRDPKIEAEFRPIRDQLLIEKRPALLPLGTGHGFVPHEDTSGFMIWNNGKVTLVDPPSNTIDYFLAHGLPLESIEGVILSHGHTDHHGDAIPKLIRLLSRVRVYTTPTIYRMLQRQYELALGSTNEGPIQWNFVPLLPQHFTEINGFWFRADYSFHVVPAIGFEIWTQPDMQHGYPAVYFSGDTYADPRHIWQLTKQGPDGGPPVLSEARAEVITRHRDILMQSRGRPPSVILIEAGIPMIHTPPESTRALIDYASAMGINTSRVFTYHVSQAVADAARVKKWQVGPEGFIDLSDHFPDLQKGNLPQYAAQVLDRLPLLNLMPAEIRRHLLSQGEFIEFASGETIIKEGDIEKTLYILIEGEVEITRGGERIAIRPNGILGEGSLLNEARNASVITTAPSRFIRVDVDQLTPYIASLMAKGLSHLRKVRLEAYDGIRQSRFGGLPPSIQDLLFLHGQIEEYEAGYALIRQGTVDQDVYVILQGIVEVTMNSVVIDHYTVGKIVGEMALVNRTPRTATVTTKDAVKVLRLDASLLIKLMEEYPGVAVALRRTAESRGMRDA